ncbi:MAG: DsbA family protein, partial [Nitrosopumilaceae archaeon]
GIDDGWANPERLKAFAFSLDLDMKLFNNCLDSGKYAKRVQHNIDEAKKAGASATPTFFIVGLDGKQEKITGAQPYSVFKNVMDSML